MSPLQARTFCVPGYLNISVQRAAGQPLRRGGRDQRAGHGQWIAAEEDGEKALASLPPEGRPYEIVWETDVVEQDAPFVARLHTYGGGR